MNADGSPAVDVQVTLGLEIEGAFTAFGLALVLVGLWLWILARRRRAAEALDPVEPPELHELRSHARPEEVTS